MQGKIDIFWSDHNPMDDKTCVTSCIQWNESSSIRESERQPCLECYCFPPMKKFSRVRKSDPQKDKWLCKLTKCFLFIVHRKYHGFLIIFSNYSKFCEQICWPGASIFIY